MLAMEHKKISPIHSQNV